ncbi:hypothetical protein E4U43_008267 [Claviceps pusilla]|uniref:CSN8/PSMD8/EIF3K domain-containing protein n=1 Tax=Claviceps pusilla TaxID=123648 RepID=A0A9P7NDH2_9HYPO|nr:hypothetical protein E4U43_008267 [Claviceps pusilla]
MPHRLLHHKSQESFYAVIVDRYMTFCSDAGQGDELLRRFSSLRIVDEAPQSRPIVPAGTPGPSRSARSAAPVVHHPGAEDAAVAQGLSDILAALRKLREGIVASKRVDDFAAQVYLFCIRVAILARQPESYHPAMLHLLRAIHPRHALTSVERAEVAGYLVLDAACRRKQAGEAMALCHEYGVRDAEVRAVLRALIRRNYVLFRRLQRHMDGYKARLMEWADRDVRIHTLKCLGKAYHSVGLGFLEDVTASTWTSLTGNDDVGWDLEEDKVVIRRVKRR